MMHGQKNIKSAFGPILPLRLELEGRAFGWFTFVTFPITAINVVT